MWVRRAGGGGGGGRGGGNSPGAHLEDRGRGSGVHGNPWLHGDFKTNGGYKQLEGRLFGKKELNRERGSGTIRRLMG